MKLIIQSDLLISNLQTLKQYAQHYRQLLGILNKLEKALTDNDQHRITQLVNSWQEIRVATNFAFIDDDIGKLIEESMVGADKIKTIVAALKEYASNQQQKPEPVDVEGLLDKMVVMVWNEIKYKAEVVRDYHHVPRIVSYSNKISQVLISLLRNAAKAIEKKGKIFLSTTCDEKFVHIDIRDTGCGIKQEDLSRIFDPFYTTRAPGQGMGLGLSTSYEIIRKLGGDIRVESIWGEGSVFHVMLPRL